MADKLSSHGRPPHTEIPDDQWDLPVTFDAEGEPVTLRQYSQRKRGVVLPLTSLTPEKRAELTAKRIEAQPKFEIAMVGGGIVDKERAIAEVKAQSDIGKVLTEIEQRVIQNLLEEVGNEPRSNPGAANA